MTLQVELPKWPIGTDLLLRKGRNAAYPARIVGYHVEHDTDTGNTNVTYRVKYRVAEQIIIANLARATVDMAPKGE